jgi:cytochrome c6
MKQNITMDRRGSESKGPCCLTKTFTNKCYTTKLPKGWSKSILVRIVLLMLSLLKVGVLLIFLFCGLLVFGSLDIHANGSSTTSAAESVSPRSIYSQNCSRCHGSNGKGQTKQGRKIEADDLTSSEVKGISDAKMTRVITNGRGKMPGFGKKLTAQQITQVAGYVRSL